jgi:hypothetical protein
MSDEGRSRLESGPEASGKIQIGFIGLGIMGAAGGGYDFQFLTSSPA